MKTARLGPEQLADVHEIQQILSTYAVAIDTRTPELLRDLFTEDAEISLGGMPSSTPERYIATCQQTLPQLDATQHSISTPLIQLAGDSASSRCYFSAQHALNSLRPHPFFLISGWYDDELVRTSDGWRIARRTGTPAWCEGNPEVLGFPDLPGAMDWTPGRDCPAWLAPREPANG